MILLTGASGFLGQIIRKNIFEDMLTLGRGTENQICCDLSMEVPTLPLVDIVIHAAGKAHIVPRNEVESNDFFQVNVQGTTNLLLALTTLPQLPKSFVYISSVAVYGLTSGQMIDEHAPLLATDPYGRSKIEAEKIVSKWCLQNRVICLILRLPLIGGPNPPGNLGAMVAGIKNGRYFNIGNGIARKSVVLAQDVAKIIPKGSGIGGIYNLTDGMHPSFYELSKLITDQLGKPKPKNIPVWFAKLMGKIGNTFGERSPFNTAKLQKITKTLTFDDKKAVELLGWKPKRVIEQLKLKED